MKKPIQDTIDFIRQAFAGQIDKGGKPVHEHSERVYRNLITRWPDASEDEQHAALLHDVLEDTHYTVADLQGMGYSDETIEIVSWVTHLPDPKHQQTYQEYIQQIANDGPIGAIKVKISDNQDNNSWDRLSYLPPKTIVRLFKKYGRARPVLEEAFFKRTQPEAMAA